MAAGAGEKELTHDNAHTKTPLAGQVGNLVLKLPGTLRGPRRMLSAHVDTVPVCVGSKPVRKGKLIESADPTTGLGADDRAGTAVLLSTAERLLAGAWTIFQQRSCGPSRKKWGCTARGM